jgi:hypothetical protein
MVLVIVVVFDATSLLPAVAPIDRGILPPLGGETRQCDGDHGGGIPLTVRDGTNNVGGGNPKRRTTRPTGPHPSWSLLHLGFFLVHSYERVGLYQFSTVNHCRLARAQKYRYAKVTTKIAIVPLAFLLIFFL